MNFKPSSFKKITFTTADGTVEEMTISVTASCPFCKHERTYSAGYLGDEETGKPLIIHAEPHCQRFKDLGVLEFLRAARLAGARAVREPS